MTEYSPSFGRAGHISIGRIIGALDGDLPSRHASIDVSFNGNFTTTYQTLKTFTIALQKDEIAIVSACLPIISPDSTLDAKLKFVIDGVSYSEDQVSIVAADAQTMCMTCYVQNKLGKIDILLQGKDQAGTVAVEIEPGKIDAIIFKRRDIAPTIPNSNFKLWLDAELDFIADQTSGVNQEKCTTWNDKSSSALVYTQASAGLRPFIGLASNLENLAIRSEEFDDGTAWPKTNTTVTANAVTNPIDGALTADQLKESASNAQHYIASAAIGELNCYDGAYYRASIYVKANGRDKFRWLFFAYGAFSTSKGIEVNLASGAINSTIGTLISSKIEDVGGGWYRVTIVAEADSTSDCMVRLYLADGSYATTYLGDGASGLFLFGAQVQRVQADETYKQVVASPNFKGVNGRRCMGFFRGTQYMDVTPNPAVLQISGNVTFYFVAQRESPNAGSTTPFLIKSGVADVSGYDITVNDGNGKVKYRSNQAGAHTEVESDADCVPYGKPAVITITKSGTTVTFYKNGKAWGSGTVANPVNQTSFQVGTATSTTGLTICFAAIEADVNSTVRQALEIQLIQKWIRPRLVPVDGTLLDSEYLEGLFKRYAARVYVENYTGPTTFSGTNNTIDSCTFQLEEDEAAFVFTDLNYKRASTDGAADFYLHFDGTLYNEKYQVVYDSGNVYHGTLAAMKSDGYGGLVTLNLKHDAVSGGNVSILSAQILILVLKKRP